MNFDRFFYESFVRFFRQKFPEEEFRPANKTANLPEGSFTLLRFGSGNRQGYPSHRKYEEVNGRMEEILYYTLERTATVTAYGESALNKVISYSNMLSSRNALNLLWEENLGISTIYGDTDISHSVDGIRMEEAYMLTFDFYYSVKEQAVGEKPYPIEGFDLELILKGDK